MTWATHLELANEVRTRRAELKRGLKEGRISLPEILSSVPEWAQTMRVEELLRACPLYGRKKAQTPLRRLEMFPSQPLKDLSLARRRAIYLYIQENNPETWQKWNGKNGEAP